MGIYLLEKRREIEGLYKRLEIIRHQLKCLISSTSEYATPDNINLLEYEEESVLTKIIKLKSLT